MDRQDIIVAPATPPGEGGVAIVRLSGSSCLDMAYPYFIPSQKFSRPESHRLYHGFIKDESGDHVDEVMFVYMAAPRTFTAEDVVEIHCHGGQQTVRRMLALFNRAGARLARAGEFSYRAFINGRIDLSQAEAIADLIHARSDKAQDLALSQLEGQLSKRLHRFRQEIKDALALIEAWIDFPEEELPREDMDHLRDGVVLIVAHLQEMIGSYNTGRYYAEGVSLLLLGKPNVGKSSLMNALLGEERAIVTEVEGTTRDLLEEGLVINGLPVRLIDAAGIRESSDPVEREGVQRARARIESVDIVLLLIDGSRAMDEQDQLALDSCSGRRHILVVTKSDLPPIAILPDDYTDQSVYISARKGKGLNELRDRIYTELLDERSFGEHSVLLTNQRHQAAAIGAVEALNQFLSALKQDLSLEFLALDLRTALTALGDITGETTTDDILDSIFSRFCIGK